MTIRRGACFLLLFIGLTCSYAAEHKLALATLQQPQVELNQAAPRNENMDLVDAKNWVKKHYHGRILRATQETLDRQQVYHIRVFTAQGKLRTINIDCSSGKIVK